MNKISIAALLSYTSIFFNIIAGILFTPWMVDLIGKSDYGLYILITSFLSFFVMDFGLGQVVAKLISKYRYDKNENRINEVLGLVTKIYLILDVIILLCLVILFFFIESIFGKFTTDELNKFKLIFVLSGAFSLLSFPFTQLNAILISYERFIFLKFIDLISKICTVSLLFAALLFGGKLFALVGINIFINFCIILVKIRYIRKTTNISIDFYTFDKDLLREILNLSFWVTIIIISQLLLNNISPTLIGIFSGANAIAIFAVGMTIAGYVWTLSTAVSGLFLPKVTELYGNFSQRDTITELMIKVGRIQLIIVGILIIGFITLGKEFIVLWMGSDFGDSYYVAILMISPFIIIVTQEIGNTYLLVANKIKLQGTILILTSVLNVILALIFVPIYGAVGCALSIFLSLVISQIIGVNYIYWKVEGLNIPKFLKECHLSLLLPLILSLISGFMIQNFISAQSLITFFPKAILLAILHFVFMWFLGMNKYEKNIFERFFKKLKQVN